MMRVLAIGECMIELTRGEASSLSMGFAGDTVNTAVYLKRLAGDEAEVRYLTAIGDDELSVALLTFLGSEGLVPDVQLVAGASPALYIVATDSAGERTFTYYRDASPVRQLFGPGHRPEVAQGFESADLIYFSAITLQLLSPAARARLVDLAASARNRGARVAFDSNYRARGWTSADAASIEIARAARVSDIALPSLSDEQLLHPGSTARDVIERYRSEGVREIIVKDGPRDVVVWADGAIKTIRVSPHPAPVDTTGAGDAFNAGYLHARLAHRSVGDAVTAAHALARYVIGHRGAIIPVT